MKVSDDDCRCTNCGEVYKHSRPQSEVIVEYLTNRPDAKLDEIDIVCDDCYKLIMGKLREH